MAHPPQATTSFGEGIASKVFFKASSMCLVTGPVTRSISACRGEATKWMPNRSASYCGLERLTISTSQPLQEPASTSRICKDLPNKRLILLLSRGAIFSRGSAAKGPLSFEAGSWDFSRGGSLSAGTKAGSVAHFDNEKGNSFYIGRTHV